LVGVAGDPHRRRAQSRKREATVSLTLLTGDCRAMLPRLDAGSVQCVITSPPYWNLRDYGVAGQLGIEPARDDYIGNLVDVFRQLRRVMRDDAVAFLNLGDCFVGKQLQGIPWRVALALQADGWYLRSDIVWSKPNPMPESVTDRPTRSHEYIFVLSKRATYYWDQEAIREPHTRGYAGPAGGHQRNMIHGEAAHQGLNGTTTNPAGRNRRSVWTVATQPYAGAHFATFPEKLIEPMVLAGTSAQACETCGAPWARQVERGEPPDLSRYAHRRTRRSDPGYVRTDQLGHIAVSNGQEHARWKAEHPDVTTGWAPTCACPTNTGAGRCVILDPFAGSGTVGRVAIKHGRNAVLIDLNGDYTDLQHARTNGVQLHLLDL
jgi:DNA modification methylase